MKSRLIHLGAVGLFCIQASTPFGAEAPAVPESPPVIRVVYPADSQMLGPVDSTSIRGSVTPGASLTINGDTVDVYRTGGFLAFLPVEHGAFDFYLVAENAAGVDSQIVTILVADPRPIPADSGVLIRDASVRPLWSRTVRPGDEVDVSFQGTVGCAARFRIVSATDTSRAYPMVELRRQIFGDFSAYTENLKRLPDSLPLVPSGGSGEGRYHGIWRVPSGLNDDSVWIQIELTGGLDSIVTATALAPGAVLPIEDSPPRVVELTDSVQILRMGPRLGYLTTFQPYGVRARWWGEVGPWTILQLAPGYEAWVETDKTRLLPEGTPLPGSLIARLATKAEPESATLLIGTSERLPYKVTVADDLHNVHIIVFGATSNTDWIALDPADDLIEDVSWSQTRPLVYEIDVRLAQPLWGYDAHYEGQQLVIAFRRPPRVRRGLSGVTIVVDAGHSAAAGAIGPTGMMEKDANLRLARALARHLERKGATVIMTRWGDADLPLYGRPAIAVSRDADLFVSIHNNSVPDGVNPYRHNGTGTYYYQPFSRELARTVQHWTLEATALDNYGVTHGNFAVIRPTQYPSILIECAFIIIPEQEELLGTVDFVNRTARGICEGISRFFRERR
ncbi:MAG: N-acetylmuramoyl-L-alanine amidase [Acidobacteria bacterium]|nr:N-acetylmuramoyl-L-alanine amidase [Acidobacteriota bacterium]